MSSIDQLFQRLSVRHRAALIPFVPAGDPDLNFTVQLLQAVAKAGADIIEIGFPFSDPIADGPVIQASYTRALNNHVKVRDIFNSIQKLTSQAQWEVPLVAMVSYSIMWRTGLATFLDEAKAAGFSGIIVPDLPVEEAGECFRLASERQVDLILLLTPTTPTDRIQKIVRLCSGFVYCVSDVGITGEKNKMPVTLPEYLAHIRTFTKLPLCLGFGISSAGQIQELKSLADGLIVGSALVRRLEHAAQDRTSTLESIASFVRQLASPLHC